ncbi:MAG: TetR/AcrR family transcriptional regulator [Bacteroidota bacterium]
MSDRKEAILEAGLKLFAEQGYAGTRTREIASRASVSEGLIFRHFDNKEGLLKAIFEEGLNRIRKKTAILIKEEDDSVFLRKIIEMPIQVVDDFPDFWRLTFSIKWSDPALKEKYYSYEPMEAIATRTIQVFSKRGFQSPEMESDFLYTTIEGLIGIYLQEGKSERVVRLMEYIKSKYDKQ